MIKHYKSMKAYKKATAYIKIHHLKTRHPSEAIVKGKIHKIHSSKRKSSDSKKCKCGLEL